MFVFLQASIQEKYNAQVKAEVTIIVISSFIALHLC